MKIIDKFLKKLNASRNTFATYILTLISIYLVVDRITEILLMVFTGVSYSYWGPIEYTLALACPIFAYLFSGKSEFASSNAQKVSLFYIFVIGLAVIAISMFMQWLNLGVWLFLISVPGYSDLVTNFSELFRPALTAISAFIPIVLGYKIFNFLYFGVNDSLECALELVKLVGHLNCYVNLIPYNETNNLEFKRSNTVQIMKFYDILKKNRLGVTIRREFGSKISAACGQLRSKKEEL